MCWPRHLARPSVSLPLLWSRTELGEEGIKRMAGEKRFSRLHKMIETHGSKAVFLACVAPPPFPYTMVVAAAAALDLSRLRICAVNFFARGLRFAVLSLLTIKYGRHILEVANSTPFRMDHGWIYRCYASWAAHYLSIHGLKTCVPGENRAKAVSDHG